MKTKRMFIVAALSGIIVFSTAHSASAQNTYYQDLLTGLMYQFLLPGSGYGPYPPGQYPDRFGNGGYPNQGPYGPAYPAYPPYNDPPRYDEGRYYDQGRRYNDRLSGLEYKYDKAMRRLDRQEREALDKAHRRYRGDQSHPGFQERVAKIQRRYDHKRQKVERNTSREYRRMTR